MARKKKTPSDAKASSDKDVSKAEAISGAVRDAEFDTPDAAMADTSLTSDEGVEAVDAATDEAVEDVSDPVVDDVSTDDVADALETSDTPEPEPEQISEPEPAPVAAAASPSTQTNGFGGTVLGGVLAAVIGFGGAIVFGAAEWPVFGGRDDTAEQQAQIIAQFEEQFEAQTSALDAVTAELETLKATMAEGQTADAESFAGLTARLDALPTTSAELMPDDLRALLAAQKAEMDTLQANLDEMSELAEGQIASAQAQQESAAVAEARAKARGALNTVRTALTSGDAFAAALPEIAAATDVPEVLQANAESGVPTAEALENEFGPAARTALSASMKATAGEAPADRVLFFLKDQLGARSLTPQEGDDPNAVLSRVEAAVRSGDFNGALETISALPEDGQAALQSWADMATTRKDALAAFESLADALSAN